MAPNRVLHIDLETCSDLDLKKVGASRYSRDPSTIVTQFAWAFDNDQVQSIPLPFRGPSGLPNEVGVHLLRPTGIPGNHTFAAWNAAFEFAFLTNWFGLTIHSAQASCTMQRALFAGLPGALDDAGDALQLGIIKDKQGKRLMMQMAKPKKDGTHWHNTDYSKLLALGDYCRRDVEAEREVGKYVPELPLREQDVSFLDRQTNNRGIRIDIPLVHDLIVIAENETRALNHQCGIVTGGAIMSPGTQTDKLTKWFAGRGFPLPDIGKETIAETLATAADAGLPDDVIQVLGIRQKVAKSSVGKLKAMLACVDADERVRGTLQYYGASRTGRFSGRLIQPQNFPRPPKEYNPTDAIAQIQMGADNEFLRTFYDEPLSVVSACLRGCLIPGDKKKFLVFDLSQIEARVIAWLAGQQDILDVFRAGVEDVYEWTANRNGFAGDRTAGKVMVLGLGFGMGHVAFVAFAKTYGMEISTIEANTIVTAWREANQMIRKFWWDLDAAAKYVIANPHGTTKKVGCLRLGVGQDNANQDVLLIELPNGRTLWYRNPRLTTDPVKPQYQAIEFDGVDQYTKKWGPIRTWGSKLAENVTQAIARDVIIEAGLRVSQRTTHAELVLSVHDEVVFEVPDDFIPVASARSWIEQSPSWASTLPVACKGGLVERYGKG